MKTYASYVRDEEPIEAEVVERSWRDYPQQPRRGAGRTVGIVLGVMGTGVGLLLAAAVGLVMVFGGTYGKEIKLKGDSQLYYTSSVKEADAHKLADWLNGNFPFEHPVSFQLNKVGSAYEFRIVVNKGAEQKPAVVADAQNFAELLSQKVFAGEKVNVILCDDQFKTVLVVPHVEATTTVAKK
ncbi:MAG TPA: hypothetical protein VMS17_01850 [Gemmataceae bacterium]|nr:hypothetical protein [Gemmataceae bacterium]